MPSLTRAGLILGLVLLNASQCSAVAPPNSTILMQADAVTIDLDRQRTEATGEARLSSGDLSLRASEFVVDRLSGRVQAKGELALVQGGRCLEGDSLEYNLRTGEGVLTEARVAEQGIIVRGREVQFSPTEVIAHQAYFTTCDLPSPHYTLGADTISLTAAESVSGRPPRSGRLTLNHARIAYRGRRLFTLPRYSVTVGDLGKPGATPLPVTGFSRDDGPYASISYSLGGASSDRPTTAADLNYRYTTLRGIRGFLRARQAIGSLELMAGYTRREDSSDRQLVTDELEAGLANVLVNRTPEYGVRLPGLPLGRSLSVRAEWLKGSYSERIPWEEETRARADRTSTSVWLQAGPYRVSRRVTLSHALGWRRASYSSGDRFTAESYRHRADLDLGPDLRLSLAHITRRGSGETPFLFDQPGPGQELLAEVQWQVNPGWRLRFTDLYDLERRVPRDMIVEATRTAHCLEYTIGWRKQRGAFFVGVGLAPPSVTEDIP